MKAIALVRVSTKAQELDSQREKVIQAILHDGYSESDIITVEDKESGSKLTEEERSGLNKLKHYIETDQVSSVYVYEISRISRKETVLYSIREYLQKKHVQLICLEPYFRLFNDDWTISNQAAFTFSIFATLSSQETMIRMARMMRGKAKKASEGKLTSGKPLYGYSILQDKTIVINEAQSKIVKEIYSRFLNGETCGSIGKDLYLTGVLGKGRLNTTRCYVSNILRDKRYTGLSPYPQIITTIEYEKAKEIRSKSNGKFARLHLTDKEYICAGLIYTDNGYAMTPSFANNRYSKSNDMEAGNLSVNMRVVDAISVYALKEFLRKGGLERTKDEEYGIIHSRLERFTQEGRGIATRLQEIEEENDRINTRIIKGRLSESDGDKMIDDNQEEAKKLVERQADVDYEISVLNNQLIYINSFMYQSTLPPLDTYMEQKDQLRRHVKKIVVSKISWARFKLTYHWKYNDHISSYSFYSMNRGVKVWDDKGQEIHLETAKNKR
jgi:DNA invertase Pin-like site-specific DNA recombinase